MTRESVVRLGVVLVVVVLAASSLVVLATAPAVAHGSAPSGAATLPREALPSAPHVQLGPHSYVITFYESGLPANKDFEITLGRSTSSTTTDGLIDSVVFSEPNGTYAYTIHGIAGWQQSTLPYKGSITVNGVAILEPTLAYTQTTYPVSFSESGVPVGQTFNVSLNGSALALTTDGGTDTLTFQAANGTELYHIAAISGWAQSTLPYRGSVTVHGAAVTEPTLVYSEVTYSVSFSEDGLPAGQTFAVSLGGVPMSLTTTNEKGTLTWTGLPNGTYPYTVTKVPGWQQGTIAPSGNVVVAGASIAEPTLMYTKSTFAVVFSESGLPVGEVFEVQVGGNQESVVADGGTDSVQFAEPNGSYGYTIVTVSGWNQKTLPYHGMIDVSGASLSEPTVVYTQVTYSIVYTETGLPAETNWSFTLNGTTETTNTTSVSFVLPNGSYAFKVGYVAGYSTAHETGTQVVDGANLSLAVPFTRVTYAVVFTESGLPSGSLWSLTVNAQSPSSKTTTITVQLPNGTFPYTLHAIAGYAPVSPSGSVTVNGAATAVAAPYRLVTYAVTFSETGLPVTKHPKTWTVTLDNTVTASTATSITFLVGNGSYSYLIEGPSGFRVSSVLAPQGSLAVNGAGVSTSVVFLAGSTGAITFHETGLASGSRWCATIGAFTCTTTTKIVVPNLTPGTYAYSVTAISGLTTIVREGKTVIGSSGSIALAHSASISVEYAFTVTFTETGLTGAFTWAVTAGGHSETSTTSTITFYLKNGSYSFHVGKVTGETSKVVASPASGAFKVDGAPISVSVKFTPKT